MDLSQFPILSTSPKGGMSDKAMPVTKYDGATTASPSARERGDTDNDFSNSYYASQKDRSADRRSEDAAPIKEKPREETRTEAKAAPAKAERPQNADATDGKDNPQTAAPDTPEPVQEEPSETAVIPLPQPVEVTPLKADATALDLALVEAQAGTIADETIPDTEAEQAFLNTVASTTNSSPQASGTGEASLLVSVTPDATAKAGATVGKSAKFIGTPIDVHEGQATLKVEASSQDNTDPTAQPPLSGVAKSPTELRTAPQPSTPVPAKALDANLPVADPALLYETVQPKAGGSNGPDASGEASILSQDLPKVAAKPVGPKVDEKVQTSDADSTEQVEGEADVAATTSSRVETTTATPTAVTTVSPLAAQALASAALDAQSVASSFAEQALFDVAGIDGTRSERFAAPLDASFMARPETARFVMNQIADVIRMGRDGTIEVSLKPEELGRVSLQLNGDGTTLNVAVSAERSETLDLLRRNADQLEQELRDLGYENLEFSFADQKDKGDDTEARQASSSGLVTGEDDIADVATSTARPLVRSDGSTGIDLRL